MAADTRSNDEAVDILQSEGVGYAVTDYCSGESFSDPDTACLWDEARAALKKLTDYLEASTGREIDG